MVWDRVSRGSAQVSNSATVSGRTVAGQARAQADRVVDAATSGVRTVAGQAAAESRQTTKVAERQAVSLLEDATAAVESSIDYDAMTRADLYELAQDREIDGRSGMKKDELIRALRAR